MWHTLSVGLNEWKGHSFLHWTALLLTACNFFVRCISWLGKITLETYIAQFHIWLRYA